jgi:hypothetical protein
VKNITAHFSKFVTLNPEDKTKNHLVLLQSSDPKCLDNEWIHELEELCYQACITLELISDTSELSIAYLRGYLTRIFRIDPQKRFSSLENEHEQIIERIYTRCSASQKDIFSRAIEQSGDVSLLLYPSPQDSHKGFQKDPHKESQKDLYKDLIAFRDSFMRLKFIRETYAISS